MRIAIGGLALESVSFLPLLTEVEDLRAVEAAGPALLDRFRGTNTLCGGFIEVCETAGAELLPIVFADGGAAGPASDAAFLHYADRLCAALQEAGPLDGVLLALHGAMTTPTRLDPDREIVERVRAVVGRRVPVVVALDYHANIDEHLVQLADGVFGYHYSPHTDIGETGARAARCLLRMLRDGLRPAMAFDKPSVMVPSIFSATGLAPLSAIVADSVAMAEEAPGYLDVSVFAGFSYADVPNCGFSVLAVSDDAARARRAVEALTRRIRRERRALLHEGLVLGLEEGVARALALAETATRPILLLEHADRCNDSTYLLRALLERGAKRAAVPYIWDPRAAAEAARAGVGAVVTLDVGGHSSPRAGGPVRVTGRVLFAGEKAYRTTGPYMNGRLVQLGLAVVLDLGGLMLSLVSRPALTVDEDMFIQFGLHTLDYRLIVLRSKTHFRAVYEELAEAILIIDTPDWGPADLTTLPYRQVDTGAVFPFTP
ncbi:M81 family peptidase [Roseomonas sp. M0104]|uniref:Microcystinase C n=1 Tax=Teichococcus coralli TaxID=2545983 RepID=A0A845BDY5_9PROT|nr:M81 family metallopeptidase [Pseudoroseomonas coralli]MXP64264.1 M81 family peptidase [Pseudoroseomonas coralli]